MNRRPRPGDPVQVCRHLAHDRKRTDLNYWRVPNHTPWIALCDDCHATYSARRTIERHGEAFPLSADVSIEPLCIEHESPRANPKHRRKPAPTREAFAAALAELECRAPVPKGWRPDATAKALRRLRRDFSRLTATTEAEWLELGLLLSRIDDLDFRCRLAAATLRRWRRLLTQIQAFADLVRREPGQAYAYRRQKHRKLLKRKKDLETLLRLLGIPLPFLELHQIHPALRDLAELFRFVPPSRAEVKAIGAQLTWADSAAAQLSLASCTAEICAACRGERSIDESHEPLIETCPGGVCTLFRKVIDTAGPALLSLSRKNGGAMQALLLRRTAKNMN